MLDDFYHLFAELSVALAGFAGVVGAFSKFRVVREAVRLRVRFLILVSVLTLVGSVLPPVMIAVGVPELVAIRISALILAVCFVPISVWAWRSLRPLQRAGLIHTQGITFVLFALISILVAGYLIVGTGGLGAHAESIYLVGLFFGIVCSCWYFVLLMFSIDIGGRE